MTLIGSTTPVASAVTTIVSRLTVSTGIVTACFLFFEHAPSDNAAAMTRVVFLNKVFLLEIMADQRFELRPGHAVVISGANQC